jgi:hypothetical protein
MSEEETKNQNSAADTAKAETQAPDVPAKSAADIQRDTLVSQAKALGIKVHHNAKVGKIKEQIAAHMEAEEAELEAKEAADAKIAAKDAAMNNINSPITDENGMLDVLADDDAEEATEETYAEAKLRLRALKHVSIVCHDPNKNDITSDLSCLHNNVMGFVGTIFPIREENGAMSTHLMVGQIEHLSSLKYNTHEQVSKEGEIKTTEHKRYSIQILKSLTPVQIEKIGMNQITLDSMSS